MTTCNLQKHGAGARAIAETTGNSKMYISLVLQDLYKGGHLKAPVWAKISPPVVYKEGSSLKNSLELVEIVITTQERDAFMTDGMSPSDLETMSRSIQTKCMNKMLVYEGGDPAVEAQNGYLSRLGS
jgi:hypothetical protein